MSQDTSPNVTSEVDSKIQALIIQTESLVCKAFGITPEMFKSNREGFDYTQTLQTILQGVVLQKPSRKTENFYRLKDHLIVPSSGQFFYYKIGTDVIQRQSGHLHQFKVRPKVLVEGMVVVDGLTYLVTVDDLRRGIIRKSRGLDLRRDTLTYADFVAGDIYKTKRVKSASQQKNIQNDTGTDDDFTAGAITVNSSFNTGSFNASLANSDFPVRGTLLQAVPSTAAGSLRVPDVEKPDMVFQEQINSLLYSLSEEEGGEWEIAEGPQSGQSDEGDAV